MCLAHNGSIGGGLLFGDVASVCGRAIVCRCCITSSTMNPEIGDLMGVP